MTITLPIPPEANALLNRDPLALLVGMVLDQQIPLERAFTAPYELTERLGHGLDVHELAGYDPAGLTEVFARRPALHRFPKAMAARVQEVCRTVVRHYDGEVAALWATAPDGPTALDRIAALPGFGTQKAQIFLALLGKRYGVQPTGWREAAGRYGEEGAYRSVADVTDQDSLQRVRENKKLSKGAARAGGAAPG
jgi:uncharacterized HhH-GPD family protein